MSKKFQVVGEGLLVKVDEEDWQKQLKDDEEVQLINKEHWVVSKETRFQRYKIDVEKYQKSTRTGVVIQKGNLAYTNPVFEGKPWCKVGDTVFFARYNFTEVPGEYFNDPDGFYLIVADDKIHGVLI